MPAKWTAEDDIKLLLAVIKDSGYKPKWDTIQAAMGPRFTAEGIRYVSSSLSPSYFPAQQISASGVRPKLTIPSKPTLREAPQGPSPINCGRRFLLGGGGPGLIIPYEVHDHGNSHEEAEDWSQVFQGQDPGGYRPGGVGRG